MKPTKTNPSWAEQRVKRRAASQRIGETGEARFHLWALEAGVTANKSTHDYGIDFMCEVLKKGDVEDITGGWLACAVRASEKTSGAQYVTLDRADAASLLRQKIAVCAVGVDGKDKAVHYRFLDIEFARKLVNFLMGKNETVSFQLAGWSQDPVAFLNAARASTTPRAQAKLQTLLAELDLSDEVEGVSLALHTTSSGTTALIEVPWLVDALAVDDVDRFRKAIFADGQIPMAPWKPSFTRIDHLADDVVVVGAVASEATIGFQQGSEVLERKVKVVRFGDEFAYRDEGAGLAFIVSASRKRGHGHFHDVEVQLFEGTERLDEPLVNFLRCFVDGAQLLLDGGQWLDIGHFGRVLTGIPPMLTALDAITSNSGLSNDAFLLFQLATEEAQHSIALLEALITENPPLEKVFGGFALADEALDGGTRTAYIPIVTNIGNVGFIIDVEARIALQMKGGEVVGLRVVKQLGFTLQSCTRLPTGGVPEMWIHNSWPAIPLVPGRRLGKAAIREHGLRWADDDAAEPE